MNEAFIYTLVTLLNIISLFFLLLFSLLEVGSVRHPTSETGIHTCETAKHSLRQRSRDAWVENILCVLSECTSQWSATKGGGNSRLFETANRSVFSFSLKASFEFLSPTDGQAVSQFDAAFWKWLLSLQCLLFNWLVGWELQIVFDWLVESCRLYLIGWLKVADCIWLVVWLRVADVFIYIKKNLIGA